MMWRRRTTRQFNIIETAPFPSDKKNSIPIPDDNSLANLIAAIAGGIEAPIQFILQVLKLNRILQCNSKMDKSIVNIKIERNNIMKCYLVGLSNIYWKS